MSGAAGSEWRGREGKAQERMSGVAEKERRGRE